MRHLQDALYAAVGAGNDIDIVAAIAGAALCEVGRFGVRLDWQRAMHGWEGIRSAGLIRSALPTAGGGQADRFGWPGCDRMDGPIPRALMIAHPDDDGVFLGNLVTDAVAARVTAASSPITRRPLRARVATV